MYRYNLPIISSNKTGERERERERERELCIDVNNTFITLLLTETRHKAIKISPLVLSLHVRILPCVTLTLFALPTVLAFS